MNIRSRESIVAPVLALAFSAGAWSQEQNGIAPARETGVVMSSSMVPRSRSRTMATAVNNTIVRVRMTPTTAGKAIAVSARSREDVIRPVKNGGTPRSGARSPQP